MKIVVYQVGPDSWRWVIRDGDPTTRSIAVGLSWYTRKADAKRGAARFEQKLFMMYDNPQDPSDPKIPIEVLD